MSDTKHGLSVGLTNYGDPDFALYLRRSFARSMGYSLDMLARPVIGIADTLFRLQQLPPPFPRADRGGEARRAGGGRIAARVPDDLARRGVPQPDQPDVPQPDGDGHRGDDPRPADGRGRAGRRLRQDRAGAADGRGLGQPAGDRARRRADDDRRAGTASGSAPAPIAAASGRNTAPARSTHDEIDEIEGNLATTAGTCAVMGTASTMASIAEALGMILPGSAAIPAVHADRLRAAEATGRAAMRLAAEKLTPDRIVTPEIGRERAARADGDRRLDQRGPASDRDRRARRRRHRPEPAQRDQRHDAGPGRSEADRAALHGGSVRRRRHRRGAARAEAAAPPRLPDGRRRDARRAPRRRRPARSTATWCAARRAAAARWAGWSRCSARSRRTARSSSARPPTRSCSRRRAAPSSSPRSRTSRRASTTPIST